MWTSADSGAGAPMPRAIEAESWLKTYPAARRVICAARTWSSGRSRNRSAADHVSPSAYIPRRSDTSRPEADEPPYVSCVASALEQLPVRDESVLALEQEEERRVHRTTLRLTAGAAHPRFQHPVHGAAGAAPVDALRPPPIGRPEL